MKCHRRFNRTRKWRACLAFVAAIGTAAVVFGGIPHDRHTGKWLIDPEMIVSRNDVLYVTPSVEPWEAMPVGGGDSSNSSVFPGGLSVVPYMDGAGLSAFGVNEVLLQSHNGLIRVLPAVSKSWSGLFRLRAQGGFLVTADFVEGDSRVVEVRSLLGKKCRIKNPWNDTCIVRRADRVVLRADASTLEFETQAGNVYILEPAGRPLSDLETAPIKDVPNQQPGLPGRNAPGS